MFGDAHVDARAGFRLENSHAKAFLGTCCHAATHFDTRCRAANRRDVSGWCEPKVQTEADKGIKTRNSGESGYVANQDKPGAASHAPGETTSTAGTTTGSSTPNDQPNINSSQADYNASLKDGSALKK